MSYCKNCKEKLEENSKFCENCGTKVEAEPTATDTKTTTTKKPKNKSLSKIQKTAIGGAVAIALLAVIGYTIGSNVYSRENQMDDLVETLISKDAEKLANVVNSNDPNFEATAENLESFTAYLDQNPNYLNQMANELQAYGEFDSFYIRQNGTRLGFYDAYELVISPIYANITTNTEGAVLSANEEELLTADNENFNQEVGPFAPGIHTFSVEGEINGYTLTNSEEVVLMNPDIYNEVNLSLFGSYFTVESDLTDATVYLNDESIGNLENGYAEFGPIQWEEGMSIHVGKTFGEDEIISDPEELIEGHSYYSFYNLSIADESVLSGILHGMYNTVNSLTRWYNTDDLESLNTYYHPDGPAYDTQRTQFTSFAESAYEDEEINSVRFDIMLNEYEQISKNSFEVDYEVTYSTGYYSQSDKSNTMRHYGKEATIIFEPTNNPSRDYDSSIYEILNEELLYEE